MSWLASVRRKREEWQVSHLNQPAYLCLDVATWKAMREELTRDYHWPNDPGDIKLLGLTIVVVPGASELFTLAGFPDVEIKIAELAAMAPRRNR